MDPYFVPVIIGSVTAFFAVLFLIAQRGGPVGDPENGTYLFRHSILLRGFALFAAFGIPIGITLLVIFNPPKGEGDVGAIIVIYALFAVLSFPLLWESMRFALLLMPDGLYCKSPWRGSRYLTWAEIQEIDFSAMSSWFIIRAVDGWTFRVYTLVPSIGRFLEECGKYLPPEALRKAKAGYERYGLPFHGPAERPVDLNELIRRANERK